MRGATWSSTVSRDWQRISIHAPHARSDCPALRYASRIRHFNPRSSCEERRLYGAVRSSPCNLISIHAPHARSDESRRLRHIQVRISIHAPHARSDSGPVEAVFTRYNFNPRSSCEERPGTISSSCDACRFQSTLLMRGATSSSCLRLSTSFLFQSTLLMRGATSVTSTPLSMAAHFNPRSSCEERRQGMRTFAIVNIFQSTLLMRGATGRVT